MRLEELAKKYSRSVPGYNLTSFFEAAFPVYRVLLKVSILTEQKLPIVQEYILKIVNCEIYDVDEIVGFLGLSKEIISESFIALAKQELINFETLNEKPTVKLTEKGKIAIDVLSIKKPYECPLPITRDALTGVLGPHKKELIPANRMKKLEIPIIKPYHSKPKVEDLDFADIRKLLVKIRKENLDIAPPEGELFDINEVEKVWIEYNRLKVLVFNSPKDNDIMIQVFERSQRAPEYERILLRMEREGIRVLPTISKEEVNESVLLNNLTLNREDLIEATVNIERTEEKIVSITKQISKTEENHDEADTSSVKELENLKKQLADTESKLLALKNESRIISTYEHRPILEQALSKAKNRVIIVSPWIKGDGMDDELLSKIKQTLSRKIEIYIGYGISSVKEDTPALRKLKQLLTKPYGNKLKLVFLGNTHEKVLICDDQFAVVTSFNWLSFKGDPKRGFRQETGHFTSAKTVVEDLTNNVMKRISEAKQQ